MVWYPHRIINRRDEAKAWAEHEWREAHEKKPWRNADATSWAAERDEKHPHYRDDGVLWAITQNKPADDDWFRVRPAPLGRLDDDSSAHEDDADRIAHDAAVRSPESA